MIERCPVCNESEVCYFFKPESDATTITCQCCLRSTAADTEIDAEIAFMDLSNSIK